MARAVFKARSTGVGFNAAVANSQRVIRLRFSRTQDAYVSKPEQLPPGNYRLHVVVAGDVGAMIEIDGFNKDTEAALVSTGPLTIADGTSEVGTFGFVVEG